MRPVKFTCAAMVPSKGRRCRNKVSDVRDELCKMHHTTERIIVGASRTGKTLLMSHYIDEYHQLVWHDFWCQVALCWMMELVDGCCNCIGMNVPELKRPYNYNKYDDIEE